MERFMSRLMVYSHDTYGLGNLRRMLSICEYLSSSIADLSILLISGSPMAHSFRLPRRLDYIKLPCLTRIEREGYSVRSLGLSLTETIRLRSDVILSAASNFKPDLLLVDKKPAGIKNELEATLAYLKSELPETRHVLILRDILDAPEATISVWERQGYHDVIQSFYDLVLVLGMAEIFDPRLEYRFPEEAAARVRFCGYLKPQSPKKTRDEIRKEFDLADQERLVLVTPGGGEDGYRLLAAYLEGLALIPPNYKIHSQIVCGPEMVGEERDRLYQAAAAIPGVSVCEFTDDLIGYMSASDVVISMGGYNTICEILSLRKKAIVVPRVKPVQEQWIRAERMSRLGLYRCIHPDDLTPAGLMHSLVCELDSGAASALPSAAVDFAAQTRIVAWISTLLHDDRKGSRNVPEQ